MADSGFDHKPFLQTLTTRPGVYRMIDAAEQVLYVGKAKNLRKRRITSYNVCYTKLLRSAGCGG